MTSIRCCKNSKHIFFSSFLFSETSCFFLFKLSRPPACKYTFVRRSTPRRSLASLPLSLPRPCVFAFPSDCPQECMIKPSFLSIFEGALTRSHSCNTPLKTFRRAPSVRAIALGWFENKGEINDLRCNATCAGETRIVEAGNWILYECRG